MEYFPIMQNDQARFRENAMVLFEPLPVVSKKRKCKVRGYIDPVKLEQETLAQIISKWNQEALRDDSELFVRTEAFNEILNGDKVFLIGRKGTGKSAIAKALILSEQYYTAQPFSFQNFPFAKFFKLGVEDYSHSQFKPIWQIIFITLALEILQKNQTVSIDVRDKIDAFFSKMDSKKGGLWNILYLAKKVTTHPMAKAIGVGTAIKFGMNPVEIVHAVLQVLPEDKNQSGFTNHLISVLDDLKTLFCSLELQGEVLVVFDELDEEYGAGVTSQVNLYADAIRSLFAAALEIHQMRIGIKPLVLLREDIFDSFEGQNKGKLKDFVCTLNWNKDELKNVIGLRLARTFAKPENMRFEKLWLELFTPFFQETDEVENSTTPIYSTKVKQIGSYDAFMRHTARTPRDCIKLLLSVAKQLKRNRMTRCDRKIFGYAREEMADYFHQQVVDATHTRIPKINQIFRSIQENIHSITIGKQKLREILMQDIPEMDKGLDDLLHILYDVSAIGILDDKKKFRAKHTCTFGYRLKKNEQIVFHPCLALYFGLDVSIAGNAFMNEYEDATPEEGSYEDSNIVIVTESTEPKGYTREMLNTHDGLELFKTIVARKTWLMTLSSIKDGTGWLSHKEFPDRVYCDFNRHSISPVIGMRVAVKIEVISSAKYGKIFSAAEIRELT